MNTPQATLEITGPAAGPSEVILSPDAEMMLDQYLARVKHLARGLRSVSVEDVTTDVREHLFSSLRGKTSPISAAEMQAALQRIGPAEQWLPLDELPLWRRASRQLLGSPRLPYVAFTLLVVGLMLPLEFAVVIVAASFCLARAALTVQTAENRWQRWLIYPALVVVYAIIVPLVICWPFAASIDRHYDPTLLPAAWRHWVPFTPGQNVPAWTGVIFVGAWIALLGLCLATKPSVIRASLYPFAERLSRWKLIVFAGVGLLTAVIGIIVLRA